MVLRFVSVSTLESGKSQEAGRTPLPAIAIPPDRTSFASKAVVIRH